MMKYAQDYDRADSLYDETLQSDQIHFSPASSYPNSPVSKKKRKQNDSDEKRARRLERNREAARRNRLKKKDWIEGLQRANRLAKETNYKLKERAGLLEEELQQLQKVLVESGYSPEKVAELLPVL